MKLFDRVSEDVRASLVRVHDLRPTSVKFFGTYCMMTNGRGVPLRHVEDFFYKKTRLELGSSPVRQAVAERRLVLEFLETVPDGVLKTQIAVWTQIGGGSAHVLVTLGSTADEYHPLRIKDIQFYSRKSYNNSILESPKTVWYIQDFVREKAMDYFLKAKADQREEEQRIQLQTQRDDAIRDKYKR